MTDVHYHSFQTERRKDAEHIHAVSCFAAHKEACTGPSDRFVLGEPVHVENGGLPGLYPPTRVFWITRITLEFEDNDEVRVHLTFARYGGHGDTWVRPTALRKLPAMLRIALEADRP